MVVWGTCHRHSFGRALPVWKMQSREFHLWCGAFRGSIAAVSHLSGLPIDKLKSVVFILPCHYTPLYSHIHRDIPVRFPDCSPPGLQSAVELQNQRTPQNEALVPRFSAAQSTGDTLQSGGLSESDRAMKDPQRFVEDACTSGGVLSPPSHIVSCYEAFPALEDFLSVHNFTEVARFFQSHIQVSGHKCRSILLFERQVGSS
ncbi:unnamed protein product [Ostreobium quekettii]|uniref:Uncharacterized protein n=1 Tax=Ostreobium quekettii TaxID=121088 RepID=A0A8S1J3J6_9CHLO|nr:unnamed protein product [Ostreobium quekettii]